MIFIERDTPLSATEIDRRLVILADACVSENDDLVRDALREVVPTFMNPEDVNKRADEAEEMLNQREFALA